MNPTDFALDPAHYGVPSRQDLVDLRIWDLHYHGFLDGDPALHRQTIFWVERMGIERVIALDIGGTRQNPLAPGRFDDAQREILEKERDRLLGMIRIDPCDPDGSCAKMERWIRNGPCIGIKYAGRFNKEGISCDHPNNDPIVRLARELGALVYVHTWLKVGGEPRRVGGANNPGESTPMEVVTLAKRFPDVPIICGHSGGDWEIGARAVRSQKNVMFEFSGSDPHSGQVDYAVRLLGVDRIVWGGHGPTRSYATELSKVLDADLTHAQRMQVFGGNLRRIAAAILRRKGYKV